MIGRRALELPADADGARVAAEIVRGMVADAEPGCAFAAELSVAEACANVVEHSAATSLRLVVRRSARRVAVAVCDRGAPFAPPAAPGLPPPDAAGGRGLALMAGCMDRVRMVRRDGENRLLMSRRLEMP